MRESHSIPVPIQSRRRALRRLFCFVTFGFESRSDFTAVAKNVIHLCTPRRFCRFLKPPSQHPTHTRRVMIKHVIFFTFCAFFTLLTMESQAQEAESGDVHFGALALDVVAPIGDFSDGLEMGLGTSVAYERTISEKIGALAGGGYIHFMDRQKESSTNQVPAYLAVRFYPQQTHRGIYLQAQGGGHVNILKYDVTEADSEVEFWPSVAPEVGYYFAEKFSLGLRYQLLFAPERDRLIVDSDAGTMVPTTLAKSEFMYVAARITYTW